MCTKLKLCFISCKTSSCSALTSSPHPFSHLLRGLAAGQGVGSAFFPVGEGKVGKSDVGPLSHFPFPFIEVTHTLRCKALGEPSILETAAARCERPPQPGQSGEGAVADLRETEPRGPRDSGGTSHPLPVLLYCRLILLGCCEEALCAWCSFVLEPVVSSLRCSHPFCRPVYFVIEVQCACGCHAWSLLETIRLEAN